MKSGCESRAHDPAGEVIGTSSRSPLNLAVRAAVGVVNKGTEDGWWNTLERVRNHES